MHLRSLHRQGGSSGSLPPYWVPLAAAYGRAEHIPGRTIDDLLWATTCLSFAVRIQDDVFDHDADAGISLFAAPLLQKEADLLLARYFPPASAFWPAYTGMIGTTIDGIARTAEIHRNPRASIATVARMYMRECAIFAIPLAAVAAIAHRRRVPQYLMEAANHCALVGQAVDDLTDIQEDLQREKVNLAALFLIGDRRPTGPRTGPLQVHIAQRILFSNRMAAFFSYLRKHLDKAGSLLHDARMDDAEAYISSYRAALSRWENAAQYARSVSLDRIVRSR